MANNFKGYIIKVSRKTCLYASLDRTSDGHVTCSHQAKIVHFILEEIAFSKRKIYNS